MKHWNASHVAIAFVTLAAVLMWSDAGWSQEPRPQPGLKWTEEQIRERVATVRAGRKLTPRSWPEGARVAVCLSFDVDNETLSLPRGNVAPVTLSAGEFGATAGLPRVLELLDSHDVPASFYVPAVSAMLGASVSGAMPSSEQMLKVFKDEFDGAYEEGTMLMLTFHPHVIGHRSRMKYLDSLITYMKARRGVWFATAEQIARYVKQQFRMSE